MIAEPQMDPSPVMVALQIEGKANGITKKKYDVCIVLVDYY
jgi:hypothetical protein